MSPGRKPDFARSLSACLCLLAWMCIVPVFTSVTNAQEYVTLLSFTNTWRYNQAGQNLGTNWVAPDYDDAAEPWQSGPALFGVETIPLSGNYNAATFTPNVIPTALSLFSGGGTNGTNIAFYFRTKFTNDLASLFGVELWATNLVDDGCVIYLNGVRVGNVRLTNANPSYLTSANAGPTLEGQYDVVSIPVGGLLSTPDSTNTMAVEVHQNGVGTSDVTFAMKLVAIVSTPLTITNQPQNVTATAGDNVAFTIGVAGGPVSYRWYRTGLPNVMSTSNSLPFVNVPLSNSGISYYCVITNALTPALTSEVATLTVIQDTSGPKTVSAVVFETGVTNIIVIEFDELLLNTVAARNTNNYRVLVSGTTNQFIAVSNIQISSRFAIVRVITNNWVIGGKYYIVLNNVLDAKGNAIAPNTIAPISWPRRLELLSPDAAWTFHAAAVFDFAVYDEDWTAPDYVEGPWWGEGPGIFYGGPVNLPQCLGPARTLVGFQPEPILFRTTIEWPSDFGSDAEATITRALDDGFVLYLNGQEIQRVNVAGPINSYTRVSTNVPNANCQSNTVLLTNLRPGTNWLATAVVQSANEADLVFGLRLSATIYVPSPVPENPAALLQLAPLGTNAIHVSWTGYGYALESTTNLALGSESYPVGPWMPVTNMSNPYTNSFTSPDRFFRLKK